jgi:hypothetical protein
MEEAAKLAAQMGVTIADLEGGAELPTAVVAQKYVYRRRLVSEERYPKLPTHMQNLHDWYMLASKREQTMLVAKVIEEYYFREDEIHIDF